jgi:hypothetical protein
MQTRQHAKYLVQIFYILGYTKMTKHLNLSMHISNLQIYQILLFFIAHNTKKNRNKIVHTCRLHH